MHSTSLGVELVCLFSFITDSAGRRRSVELPWRRHGLGVAGGLPGAHQPLGIDGLDVEFVGLFSSSDLLRFGSVVGLDLCWRRRRT